MCIYASVMIKLFQFKHKHDKFLKISKHLALPYPSDPISYKEKIQATILFHGMYKSCQWWNTLILHYINYDGCSSTIDSALTETRKLIALTYDIGYYRSDPDLCTMRWGCHHPQLGHCPWNSSGGGWSLGELLLLIWGTLLPSYKFRLGLPPKSHC